MKKFRCDCLPYSMFPPFKNSGDDMKLPRYEVIHRSHKTMQHIDNNDSSNNKLIIHKDTKCFLYSFGQVIMVLGEERKEI